MRIDPNIYTLNADKLAQKLLGMKLCRFNNGSINKFTITETECYLGEEDTACHAHKGKTNRTKILYEEGGLTYIYLCYGIHYMLNIVSGPSNYPQAVLIRGIDGFDGPGKLTKALNIDKSFNGENLNLSNKLWLEYGNKKYQYQSMKRIGIDYATDECRNKLWRFKIIK